MSCKKYSVYVLVLIIAICSLPLTVYAGGTGPKNKTCFTYDSESRGSLWSSRWEGKIRVKLYNEIDLLQIKPRYTSKDLHYGDKVCYTTKLDTLTIRVEEDHGNGWKKAACPDCALRATGWNYDLLRVNCGGPELPGMIKVESITFN